MDLMHVGRVSSSFSGYLDPHVGLGSSCSSGYLKDILYVETGLI